MTEERRVQHKLSLARAFRRLTARFRQGEDSTDYLRWQREQDGSDDAKSLRDLMREEGRGRF